MSEKSYTLTVYDPASKSKVTVEVTKEVYDTHRRSGWNIKKNAKSFFDHEIQMSVLIGGEDGSYENFREFVSYADDPMQHICGAAEREALWTAVASLPVKQREVIEAIYLDGMTQVQYAESLGLTQQAVGYRLKQALKTLREKISE
jgi:RNA polymerase sigma factor (sigma-70 family)